MVKNQDYRNGPGATRRGVAPTPRSGGKYLHFIASDKLSNYFQKSIYAVKSYSSKIPSQQTHLFTDLPESVQCGDRVLPFLVHRMIPDKFRKAE